MLVDDRWIYVGIQYVEGSSGCSLEVTASPCRSNHSFGVQGVGNTQARGEVVVWRLNASRQRTAANARNENGIGGSIVPAALPLVERFIREPGVPAQAIIQSQFGCEPPRVFRIVVHAPLHVLLCRVDLSKPAKRTGVAHEKRSQP